MKLATTTGDILAYVSSPAEAVRAYEGTGFTHLDYNFYRSGPQLSDGRIDRETEDALHAAQELDFDFVQAHSPCDGFLSGDFEYTVAINARSIERCAFLGIDRIVVHPDFTRDMIYDRDMDRFFEENRRFFSRLYPAMEKYGVRVLVENTTHANVGNYCFLFTAKEMNDFISYCSHPLLGVCWDTGHANIEPFDQGKELAELGKNLGAVHVHDNLGVHDDHMAPFMGTLDVDAVMDGLRGSGFIDRGGVFTFECDNLLSRAASWPNSRKKAPGHPENTPGPSLKLRRASLKFLYEIGCDILERNGLTVE